MEEDFRSLEIKLNKIIDNELQKDISQIDDELILACCDGLLRMEDYSRYMITESEAKKSIDSITGKKSKSVIRMTKPIKIMLIAAIIAILLVIGSLGYSQYKYNIFKFSDHSTIMFNKSGNKRTGDFGLNFVPEGFTLNYESNNKYEHSKEYINGDEFFIITKQSGSKKIDINTEYKASRVTTIDGIDYIEFGEAEHGQGVVWEKNGYQYSLSGNVQSRILLEIAISVSDD